MESIGETLRNARSEKNVTLEDVARATRIKLDILEKMEGDEFSALASPMYVKGFLKLYTDYLGLDSQPIIDSFLSSQGGVSHHKLQLETEVTSPPRKASKLKLPARKTLFVVAVLTISVSVVCGIILFWPDKDELTNLAPATAELPMDKEVVSPEIPSAEFDAYYHPKIELPSELIELPDR